MQPLSRLIALGLAVATASAVQAQVRQVQPRTNTVPAAGAQAARAAPDPAGLTSRFPAGISTGSGAAVSTDPLAAGTAPITGRADLGTPGTNPGGRPGAERPPADDEEAPVATTVLGAGATVRGPGEDVGGAGGFSAVDEARSFFFADANHDGELTRAEAQRLSIRSLSFEEMDRNFDGVISRFEYGDSLE